MRSRILVCVTVVTVCLLATSCDPEAVVNEYFAKQGLNRLAYLRDDIQPGGIVLVNEKGAMYADNMFDYVAAGSTTVPLTAGDGTSDYQAVLRNYQSERAVDANAAIKFLQTFLPVDLSSSLSLKNSVKIDLVNARVRRMKIPDVRNLLNSNAGATLRAALRDDLSEPKTSAFLIYETWLTNKLKISTSSGTEITDSINVNEVKVISSASGSFSIKRTSSSDLEISGDKFYVFAVRTGLLQPNGQSFAFKPMDFKNMNGWGVKAGPGDESFSAPIKPDFSPVRIESRMAK